VLDQANGAAGDLSDGVNSATEKGRSALGS
jgi:hypothetical protein